VSLPAWLAKFASRKFAALAGVLLCHYLISKGMETTQANAIAEAVVQAVLAIIDGLVAWKYLDEQGRLDREAARDDRSTADRGVDDVLAAARKVSTITVVGEVPMETNE